MNHVHFVNQELPFKAYLREHFDAHDYHERLDRMKFRMIDQFLANPDGKWRLIKVPANRTKRIWLEFGKRGTISDLNGLDKIAEALTDGILSLRVATQLQGHTDDGMGYHEMFDEVMEWDEEETNRNVDQEKLYEWLVVDLGGGRTMDFLSDYGLAPLERLLPKIMDEEKPEERLYAIDRAFNIIHQRSDLCAFFIEGGTKTLLEIANQGGYSGGYQNNR